MLFFRVSKRNLSLDKKLFLFQASAKKDLTFGFKNFNRKTKSAVIHGYENFFYFTNNQQSS